ncbi:MAG: aminopeptidase [Caldilineaceae bacterium]|nr:aminopeptidase [Caldilineaceae bacterium]
MTDPRVDRLADILVNYSAEVRPGDWVLVKGGVLALPLIDEVVKYVVRAGGHPSVTLLSDSIDEVILREASAEQLGWVSPFEEKMARDMDVRIIIRAPSNTRSLTGMDPSRQNTYQNAQRKFLPTYLERTAAGQHRWVGTLYPCDAYAQEADMSLREYEDFVYAATYADQADPVQHWCAIHDMQQRLIDWLDGKHAVVVRGPDIDMQLSIEGRTFVNSDGKRNMPSGEIYTGPVEESVNGWVRFSYPAIRGGREVSGVEFEFSDGKVVTARAEKNEAYLLDQLETDDGSRYLGEFAFGTNYQIQRFTKNILYDEKIGGTLHMAVGSGYPETGSRNRSAVHWDFICNMRHDSEVWIDGELFYKNGKFQV